jgi:hypothetical protein
LAAFLRLGKKYEIQQLYAESVARLSREFPSTLAKWEAAHDKNLEIESSPTLAFDVINLARETGFLAVLPTAFYHYCDVSLNIKGIFDGVERSDGSVVILRPEDQRACMMGWQQLIETQARETFSWLNTSTAFCYTQRQCNSARGIHFSNLSHPIPSCLALEPWDADWEEGLCQTCVAASKGLHNSGRLKMWNLLPSFFSLPPWEKLLEDY